MIVDLPLNSDLAQGVERRILQDGDSQVMVPNVLLPVVLGVRVHDILATASLTSVLRNTSFLVTSFVTRTNLAATTFGLGNMDAGLWEIELSMSTWFNFESGVIATSDVHIRMSDQVVAPVVLGRFPSVGSFTDFNRQRYLFNRPVEIQLSVPLTGAAETLNVRACVNAIKIL